MKYKVILGQCSSVFWADVGIRLAHEVDWDIRYWVANPSHKHRSGMRMREYVGLELPHVVFHPILDAVRGVPAQPYASIYPAPLDGRLLHELSQYESIVLRMMDRMDPGGVFAYGERVRHYHRLMGYWLAVLRDIEPDLVVFSITPHMVYDYVLYALCGWLGIRTLMFERTSVPGLLLTVGTFEESPQRLRRVYLGKLKELNGKVFSLSPDMETYLSAVRGSYQEGMPYWTRRQIRQPIASVEKATKVRRYPRYIALVVRIVKGKARKFLATPSNYLKIRVKTPEESEMNWWQWRVQRLRAWRKKRALHQHYENLTETVDMEQPYVFLALHYQPERMTSPKAGVFVNQLAMVRVLSEALPSGWHLFVKEHPLQFANYKHGERSRDAVFYDDLASIPHVRIVSMSIGSFELVDGARAVATATGTVGWEAILRGKPTLVFGHAWYRDCDGAFFVQDDAGCRSVLDTIAGGYEPDESKLRAFIAALEETAVRGYVDPALEGATDLTYDENVAALVTALHNAIDADAMTPEKLAGDAARNVQASGAKTQIVEAVGVESD